MSEKNGAQHGFRILVAEDDAEMRSLLVDELTDAGYRVYPVGDGAEAADYLAAQPFDLMVTDMKMPRMDGVELLAVVKARGLLLPVIAISSFFDEGSGGDTVREQALACLSKPLKMDELKSIIHTALHKAGR